MPESPASQHHTYVVLLATVIILAGMARIAATYAVFSHTYDEPAHIAAGMEWLDRGTYTYEPMHPPLARVAVAIGPWLDGARSAGLQDMWDEGDAILHATGADQRTLILARLGILPFFLLASALVWTWTRQLFGAGSALLATCLFTTLPPVLAHGGVATTDMALSATLLLATYAVAQWFARPTPGRSLALGASIGAAILAKLSALVMLPACILAIAAWQWIIAARRNGSVPGAAWAAQASASTPSLRSSVLVVCAALLVLWAGYRFSLAAVTTAATRPHELIDQVFAPAGALHDAIYGVAEAAILPFSELVRGIAQLAQRQADGNLAYLLGETSRTGWWWFFPVALSVKTPIAFLLLAALGGIASLRASWRGRRWNLAAPTICAAAVLVTVLPSRINIGLRHVLPIYAFLALAAGFGACWLAGFARHGVIGRAAAMLLLTWHVASGAVAHPDYLAYFNEIAGRRPDQILVDSDLDWGQDVYRLADAARAHGVAELAMTVLGHRPESRLVQRELPGARPFDPEQPGHGWVAVSLYFLRNDPKYSWLNECAPVALVGTSIRLYHLSDETAPALSKARPDQSNAPDCQAAGP
jgi:hypothetical protein